VITPLGLAGADADGCPGNDGPDIGSPPVPRTPPEVDVLSELMFIELEVTVQPSNASSPEMYVWVSAALILHVDPSRHDVRSPNGGLSRVPVHTQIPTVPLRNAFMLQR
jgi:hypothetical protein